MDFEYDFGNSDYAGFFGDLGTHAVSAECDYIAVWNSGDTDDAHKKSQVIPIAIGRAKFWRLTKRFCVNI